MIVHVLGRMTAGGNERLCLELLRHSPPGVSQALITIDPTPHGPLESLFQSIPGLQFHHEPYSPDARARFVFRMARRLRALRPTGVITYPFGLHLGVCLASKVVPGCRFICHVGNPPPPSGPRREMFRRIVHASRWLGAPLWSCSVTVHERFEGLGIAMPADSRPLPNGVNIERLRSSAERGRARRTERGPVIAMVARLDEIKDHDTLLTAFAKVVAARPDAKLWLVGDGQRKAVLEQYTAQLGLSAAVSFVGVRQDVGELLGQTDVFVFSTTQAEGFGIALAEAMAVGLPIVASDVPACREVLAGGAAGDLVPPRAADEMARAILVLLDDKERAHRIGIAAEERARAAYDVGLCAERYYEYLLG
jgi:glycosyltransferase involved in cell wall biosynthesis